jgi:hypothetical protein
VTVAKVHRIGAALLLAFAAPALVGATQADAPPLPRDRQVLLERHLGHLRAAGEVSCVLNSRVADEYIISDTRILYRASRGLVFDATLNPGCAGLARSPYAPHVRSSGSQLCRGDTIEVVGPGGPTASCTIASITRWERPPTE